MSKKIVAIILCGGSGNRFNKVVPKQFYKINNKTLLEINLEKFSKYKKISELIIVARKQDLNKTRKICSNYNASVVVGGQTRQVSVKNGLKYSKKLDPNIVLIHDCARPFTEKTLINKLILNTKNNYGCIPIVPVTDSINKVLSGKEKIEDIDRTNLYMIQTPQSFPFKKIYNAHMKIKSISHTDDSSIAKKFDIKINTILGLKNNMKITTKDDIDIAKMIYRKDYKERITTGLGFDVHKFEKGNFVVICGIKIPFDKKLKGHSDADIGFHALVDAILGSISEDDIGKHFPPSDMKWKNAPSKIFVEFARDLLIKKNAIVQNIDITIICEEPKISKYRDLMKKNISSLLKVDSSFINIKGTTTEKLGFLGREEGIAAQVLVTTKINEFP